MERSSRRKAHPERRTISVYVLNVVVEAVDALVASGRYANRSDAVEDACRLLVLHIAVERPTETERVA